VNGELGNLALRIESHILVLSVMHAVWALYTV